MSDDEKNNFKDSVWYVLGVSEEESKALIRRTKATFELYETHTEAMEHLFPEKDPKELAKIYAYAVVYGGKGTIGGFEGLIGAVLVKSMFDSMKEDSAKLVKKRSNPKRKAEKKDDEGGE